MTATAEVRAGGAPAAAALLLSALTAVLSAILIFRLAGAESDLSRLEQTAASVPPGGLAAGAVHDARPGADGLTPAERAQFAGEMGSIKARLDAIMAAQEHAVRIPIGADLPASASREALVNYVDRQMVVIEDAQRVARAKKRLEECGDEVERFWVNGTLAKELKLEPEQARKIAAIVREELGAAQDYLAMKEHSSDEATRLKASILEAADLRILGVLDPDQNKLYPKFRKDWIGGMLHIAGAK